mmetsp:Transcript_9245/g.40470  ORF Transcript_9245/g.40470 Transcript_9245/m.40470 type:complete len:106 (-) Transcript_9245:1784-2101(-)
MGVSALFNPKLIGEMPVAAELDKGLSLESALAGSSAPRGTSGPLVRVRLFVLEIPSAILFRLIAAAAKLFTRFYLVGLLTFMYIDSIQLHIHMMTSGRQSQHLYY